MRSWAVSKTKRASSRVLILDAWLELTEAARSEAIQGLGTRLIQARARHEGAKALDEALFGEEFEAA